MQHYHEDNDGLPCRLRLPKSIERANAYELNQFWIMGPAFWNKGIDVELTDSGGSNSDPTDRGTLERDTRFCFKLHLLILFESSTHFCSMAK